MSGQMKCPVNPAASIKCLELTRESGCCIFMCKLLLLMDVESAHFGVRAQMFGALFSRSAHFEDKDP